MGGARCVGSVYGALRGARARGSSLAETLDSKSCRVGHLPTVSGRSRGAPDGSRAGVSRVRSPKRAVGPVKAIFGCL